jgi:hypothetical protein
MKKYSMNVYDNCGCDEWVAAFVKTVFTHARIGAEELVIYDMDHKRIFIRAEVWDATLEPDVYDDKPGGWVEKTYTIKYYQEDEPWRKFLLSYVLYDDERIMVACKNATGEISYYDSPTEIEQGAYRIVPRWGKAKCIRKII